MPALHPYRFLCFMLAVLAAVYALGVWLMLPPALTGKAVVREVQFFTGASAWVLASLMVIFAARPPLTEQLWGPVDQGYRLHKILGLTCVVLIALHFFGKEVGRPIYTAFFEQSAAVQNAAAPAAQPAATNAGGAVRAYSLRSLSKDSGLYLTYLSLVLVILTFVSKLPYRFWLKTHRLFPGIYLLMTLHCLYLMEPSQRYTPLGILVLVFTVLSWPFVLLEMAGLTGWSRRTQALVAAVQENADYLHLSVLIPADSRFKADENSAGRFVFVRMPGQNAHPYTLADLSYVREGETGAGGIRPDTDCWQAELYLRKAGNFVAGLQQYLQSGHNIVNIEGPYGNFVFRKRTEGVAGKAEGKPQQVLWLLQGAGLAMLPAAVRTARTVPAAAAGTDPAITLLLLVRHSDDLLLQVSQPALQELVQQGKLNLTVHVSSKQGRLSGDRLREFLQQGHFAAVSFCGRADTAAAVRQTLRGVPVQCEYVTFR